MKITIEPRLMRMRQIAEYAATSKAFIYQKIAEGEFPEGHLISPGIKAWERRDVDAWIDQKLEEAS